MVPDQHVAERDGPRGPRAARYALLLTGATAGTGLVAGALLAVSRLTLRELGESTLPAIVGSLILLGVIGLWLGKRWAAYLTGLLSAGATAIVAWVVFSSWLSSVADAQSKNISLALIGVGLFVVSAILATLGVAVGGMQASGASGPTTRRASTVFALLIAVALGPMFFLVVRTAGPDGVPAAAALVLSAVVATIGGVLAVIAADLYLDRANRPWSIVIGAILAIFVMWVFVNAAPIIGQVYENVAADCPPPPPGSGCL